MTNEQTTTGIIQAPGEQWAILELMGHAQTAGRVTKPGDWGNLIRVDIPVNNSADYRTEFYGLQAIYSIRFVSEEIARAYAPQELPVDSYSAPIVTREEHEAALREYRQRSIQQGNEISELKDRLTRIQALPSGDDGNTPVEGIDF